MNTDTLFNYFEEYNLNNDTIFIICFVISSFVIIANTYFLVNYLYKKCCKKCCRNCCNCTNKVPTYIENKNLLTDELILTCEPLV
mgnify:FL=1